MGSLLFQIVQKDCNNLEVLRPLISFEEQNKQDIFIYIGNNK